MSLLSVYYGSKKVVMTQSNKYRHQFEVNDLTSSFETFCGFAGRDEKISTIPTSLETYLPSSRRRIIRQTLRPTIVSVGQ